MYANFLNETTNTFKKNVEQTFPLLNKIFTYAESHGFIETDTVSCKFSIVNDDGKFTKILIINIRNVQTSFTIYKEGNSFQIESTEDLMYSSSTVTHNFYTIAHYLRTLEKLEVKLSK